MKDFSTKIYCQIRKIPVVELPEERVRQRLLKKMTEELHFPISHIAIEKNLRQMPHLEHSGIEIPDRRADIVCFAKEIHPIHNLYPLLLVECKAVPLTEKVLTQVTGYNHYMRAYFVTIANEEEVRTGWYDFKIKAYRFVNYLPSYQKLVHSCRI